MSVIRRCDICKRDIDIDEKYMTIIENSNGEIDKDVDICPSCWVELVNTIRAKQRRREESKEAEKMFSEPWDPGVMVATRRD